MELIYMYNKPNNEKKKKFFLCPTKKKKKLVVCGPEFFVMLTIFQDAIQDIFKNFMFSRRTPRGGIPSPVYHIELDGHMFHVPFNHFCLQHLMTFVKTRNPRRDIAWIGLKVANNPNILMGSSVLNSCWINKFCEDRRRNAINTDGHNCHEIIIVQTNFIPLEHQTPPVRPPLDNLDPVRRRLIF